MGFLFVLATIAKKAVTAKGPKSSLAKIMLVLLAVMWVWMAQRTGSLNKKIHWAPRRAALAKVAVEQVTQSRLKVEKAVEVEKSNELKFALNDQDAMKVILGEEVITLYY